MTTIYIVRHGESKGNVNWRLGKEIAKSKLGSRLTRTGKEQVTTLAKKLAGIKFDTILSSPLTRAKQTAKLIAQEKGLVVLTKKALQERQRGNLDGKSELKLRKKLGNIFGNPNVLTDRQMWQWKLFDDMESAEEAVTRFITALREIAVAYPGKTILVVAHGTVMRCFLVRLGYANFKELPHGSIENTGYIKVATDGVDFFIKETKGITLTHG